MTARSLTFLLVVGVFGWPVAGEAREFEETRFTAMRYARLIQLVQRPDVRPVAIGPASRSDVGQQRGMRGERPFAADIKRAALRNGLKPEFLLAVNEVESNFDPHAASPKNALGLAQVMPATALDVGITPGHLWLPDANAEAGARYLRWLGERYGWDARRMLIGYNAGPLVADGGRPVPAETRAYVTKVVAVYRRRLEQARS